TLAANEDAEDVTTLSELLGRLRHIDEPERLRTYQELLAEAVRGTPRTLGDRERARVMMLEAQFQHRGTLRAAEATVEYLAARPTIVRELTELREVLEDNVGIAEQILPVPEWTLALHRHYSRREIVAAVGYVKAGDKSLNLQSGILRLKDEHR